MSTLKYFILLLFITYYSNSFSQITNFRIYPSGVAQIEPSIAKHPANPLIMFASAYTISGAFRSEAGLDPTPATAALHPIITAAIRDL